MRARRLIVSIVFICIQLLTNCSTFDGGSPVNNSVKEKKREDTYHGYDPEEKDYHYFTKCEYYTRYAGTSHFAMNDYNYWGTYFRSTGRGGESGRFTRKDVASKTFKNPILNIEKGDSYHSRTGAFCNPYTFEEYKKSVEKPERFKSKPPKQSQDIIENLQKLNLENPLYEELLDYRNQICLQIFNRTLELLPDDANNQKNLELIHHNEYPCLIVKIPLAQHFEYTEDWNKLFIAYYVAIINQEAEKARIPIEMVIRSGFGHLLPSIDVTGSSFRINVGIVPACYGDLIAKSLVKLQEIITKKLDTTLEHYDYQKGKNDFIEKTNDKIKNYNKLKHPDKVLPTWNKKQKCYEILQLQGDPSGKNVICQITRKRIYLDLLADYVAEELDKQTPEPDLTFPIVRMLGHLDFGASVSTNINQSSFKRNARKWQGEENPLLSQDKNYWRIITQIVKSIGGNAEVYNHRVLDGLYSKLEKANKEFIIRSASTIAAEDGLGSDSDYEVEIRLEYDSKEKGKNKKPEKQQLYAKKLTVTTGMMAINVAHYLARYYLKQYLGIKEYRAECKSMYYETEESLKLSAKGEKKLAVLNNRKQNNPTLLFFDLNHCDVSGGQHTRLKHYMQGGLIGKNIPAIVMDYSSSTASHIKCAINDAIEAGVKLILLVSSGLKNEQLSADNPYGTVRIVTLDKGQREKLYKKATTVLKENGSIPATAQKIRKGYKKIGLELTNQQILKAGTNKKKFEEDTPAIVNQLYKNPYEIARYKRILLEQIDEMLERPIKVSEEQRKWIGEVRARELEQETVIGSIENTLRRMLTRELSSFVKERMEENIEMAFRRAESRYEEKSQEYQQSMQDYEEGEYEEWDHEGPVKPESPVWIDKDEIRDTYEDEYGDLNDLPNLIKLSNIQDDVLSQILYDNFITIDGMDDILEALEHNTLNLDQTLTRRILNNCDVPFYEVDLTQNGFIMQYLKESIKERFKEIEAAYPADRDEQGRTALHIAAEKGHDEEVSRLLLDNPKTDINAQDKYGSTPLHIASEKGHLKVVELLIIKGANIKIRSIFGTPLDEAISSGKIEVGKFLLRLGKNIYDIKDLNHSLQEATRQGKAELVDLIITEGANINIQNERGDTPLHIAALNAHVDVLKVLLRKGTNTNIKNKEGNTPLHEAAGSMLCSSNRCERYVEACKLLIKQGAQLETQNNEGLTPIKLASQKNKELYKLLVT